MNGMGECGDWGGGGQKKRGGREGNLGLELGRQEGKKEERAGKQRGKRRKEEKAKPERGGKSKWGRRYVPR